MVTLGGLTASSDFPTTAGAFDTTYNSGTGGHDGFVTRLDLSRPRGSQITYSTFVGAAKRDAVYAVGVDGSGTAFFAGRTDSSPGRRRAGRCRRR